MPKKAAKRKNRFPKRKEGRQRKRKEITAELQKLRQTMTVRPEDIGEELRLDKRKPHQPRKKGKHRTGWTPYREHRNGHFAAGHRRLVVAATTTQRVNRHRSSFCGRQFRVAA